jgi:hypothetical protein
MKKNLTKFANPDFARNKKCSFLHFKCYNDIILQSMWSIFLKFFPRITLIVLGKILQLDLKKK